MSKSLLSALRDLSDVVDSVCDSDALSAEGTLEPHARTGLELSLQRALGALRARDTDPVGHIYEELSRANEVFFTNPEEARSHLLNALGLATRVE